MTQTVDRRMLLKGGAALGGLSLGGMAFARNDHIETLLGQMTVAEKAGQLSCFADRIRPPHTAWNPNPSVAGATDQLGEIRAGRVSMLFNGEGAEGAMRAQRVAVEESRLKIPLLFAADVIHGLRTIYPVPLAESCAFDPDLVERTARAAALEMAALGIHWTFAPMVDVARDQRWGRVVEGSGEDPYLGALLGVARVRGFQGDDLRQPTSIAACAKHFVGYGAVSGGMEYNSAEIAPATLHDIHLVPFKACVDAGVATIMSAFNTVDGVPASGNRQLLTDLLRDQWQFSGMVVGDYTADEELIAHGYAADGRDAAKKAFLAGMDMAMESNLLNLWLPDLVAKGEVAMAHLDDAVRRVLYLKARLDLFENPYRKAQGKRGERAAITTPAMLNLSREAGARSIVLLKNERDILPLPAHPGRIALIGPFGEDRDNVVGPWALIPDTTLNVSIAQGLRARGLDVAAVAGSAVEAPLDGGIAAAVAAARAADIVLLAIGEAQLMSGEAQSRTDIGIPAAQLALAEAVAATGKPIVVLLRHGRALALKGAVKNAPAILATWFLGSESGNAIADILFGDVNPSAKLAVSFPHETGQQPYFYNHASSGRPGDDVATQRFKARYRETPNTALYPFGHGLSYTSFAISDVRVPETMGQTLQVSANVTNTGRRPGAEVVQLYIHDVVASRVQPVRALKRFQRLTLSPGDAQQVTFTLTRDDLAFWSDKAVLVEPGLFELWVATSSTNGERRQFTLL